MEVQNPMSANTPLHVMIKILTRYPTQQNPALENVKVSKSDRKSPTAIVFTHFELSAV